MPVAATRFEHLRASFRASPPSAPPYRLDTETLFARLSVSTSRAVYFIEPRHDRSPTIARPSPSISEPVHRHWHRPTRYLKVRGVARFERIQRSFTGFAGRLSHPLIGYESRLVSLDRRACPFHGGDQRDYQTGVLFGDRARGCIERRYVSRRGYKKIGDARFVEGEIKRRDMVRRTINWSFPLEERRGERRNGYARIEIHRSRLWAKTKGGEQIGGRFYNPDLLVQSLLLSFSFSPLSFSRLRFVLV